MTDPTLLADLGSELEPGRWARGAPCANCGEPLGGPYCSECGQRSVDLDPSTGALLHEAAHELTDVDGKLLTTLRALVKPGFLTQEFLAGRRASYLSPIRLYLMLSVAFFAASVWWQEPNHGTGERQADLKVGAARVRLRGDTLTEFQKIDALTRGSGWMGQRINRGLKKTLQDKNAIRDAYTAQLPRAMFVLVPMFGLLLALVYRTRRQRYPRHLYFAIHLHAFVFLTLLVVVTSRLTGLWQAVQVLKFAAFASWIWYLVRALEVVYGDSRKGAIARTGFIAVLYLPALVAAMGISALIALMLT